MLTLSAGSNNDHGQLNGLADDDHTQYVHKDGRSGGQTIVGGTGTTDDLVLKATSGVGTTGSIVRIGVGNNGGTIAAEFNHNGCAAIGPSAVIDGNIALTIPASGFANVKITDTYGTLVNTYTSDKAVGIAQNLFQSFNNYYSYGTATNNGAASMIYSDTKNSKAFAVAVDDVITAANQSLTMSDIMRLSVAGDLGIGTTAAARLHILKTTEQLRTAYDASNYMSVTVGSAGSTTFDLVGTSPEFTFSDPVNVPDEAYGAGWNGNTEVPTKNAVYDKIETINPINKAISIESPTSSEKIVMFYNAGPAITLSEIRSVVFGTTPSVTFSIRYGTDVSAAGTEVVTSGITVTNTTTGTSTTSFNNGTIPADNFVWITTSATSGTVDQLHVTITNQ